MVVGRGSSDMKSGNVIAMACFEDAELRGASPYCLALVLYAEEEGPADQNELADVLREISWLRDAALAIVLEPTDGEVQLGCMGALHAQITFVGQQAHSARPWQGRNALTMSAPFLAAMDAVPPTEVEVDGIRFRDVWALTQAATGNARNVIPGEFTVNLNLRFAPSRAILDAERELTSFVHDHAGRDVRIEIVDRAPPAPPRCDDPLVAAFVDAVGATVTGKQAWTDVARFAELGVPALNFGPGLTAQAHQRGEFVPVASLTEGYQSLRSFLSG